MLNIELGNEGQFVGLIALINEYNHFIQAAEIAIPKRQIKTHLKRTSLVSAINRFTSIYRNLDRGLAMIHWEILATEKNLILNLYARLPQFNLQSLPEQERNTARVLQESINSLRELNIVQPPVELNVEPPQNDEGPQIRRGEADNGIWILRNAFLIGGAALTVTGVGNIAKGAGALNAAGKITELAAKEAAKAAAIQT